MAKKRVALVVVSYKKVYERSKITQAIPILPSLGLATVAGSIRELGDGYDVRIVDLNVENNENQILESTFADYQPDMVGVSFTIQNTNRADEISRMAKEYNEDTITVAGGPHVSLLENGIRTVQTSSFDIAVVGEADLTIQDILKHEHNLANVPGIVFKNNGNAIANQPRAPIEDLDTLPMPAWHLFKLERYKMPKLLCKKPRVAPIETSRGCPFRCNFCSRNVFGMRYKYKSPKRVVKEFQYMKECGFEEVHVMDDMFTLLRPRAQKICEMLAEEKNDIYINIMNGIRVNSVDMKMLQTMKAANVYRASFGAESGNQKVLDDIQKGIKVEDIPHCFKMCREVGIESLGYFMLGFPADTEESMQDTIDIAKKADPDIAKVDICTPMPGTLLFDRYQKMGGVLKVTDWSNFIYHDPREVYNHPTLSWDTIYKYYHKFYRQFYFRPKYITRRFVKGIREGTLMTDISAFFKTPWFSSNLPDNSSRTVQHEEQNTC